MGNLVEAYRKALREIADMEHEVESAEDAKGLHDLAMSMVSIAEYVLVFGSDEERHE